MVPQLCCIGTFGPPQVFQEIRGFNCALCGVGTAPVFLKPPYRVITTKITQKVY